jgi:hypothetical protein
MEAHNNTRNQIKLTAPNLRKTRHIIRTYLESRYLVIRIFEIPVTDALDDVDFGRSRCFDPSHGLARYPQCQRNNRAAPPEGIKGSMR